MKKEGCAFFMDDDAAGGQLVRTDAQAAAGRERVGPRLGGRAGSKAPSRTHPQVAQVNNR